MGTCIRSSPTQALSCYVPMCNFMHFSLDKILEHVQKEHNSNNKVSVNIALFPALIIPPAELDDFANLASGEESKTDVSSSTSFGPIRGRQPQLLVRPTPYQRTSESSSRSISPMQRPALRSLSPLQISSVHPLSAPSPLQQLAFSRPNSPSPPLSDNEMNVDENAPSFNEEEVLAKASVRVMETFEFES